MRQRKRRRMQKELIQVSFSCGGWRAIRRWQQEAVSGRVGGVTNGGSRTQPVSCVVWGVIDSVSSML